MYREISQGWFFKFYLALFHLKVNKSEHSSEFYDFSPLQYQVMCECWWRLNFSLLGNLLWKHWQVLTEKVEQMSRKFSASVP